MEIIENQNEIHLVLKDLIDQKSKRDHSHFNLCQLARAIDMPHSILSKLTHEDPARRVSNPRIETLSRIVNFFRRDGFDITIDELMAGPQIKTVQEQIRQPAGVPLYFLDSDLSNKIGTVEVDIAGDIKHLIAFVSDEYIEPMFKKGSVFIVNTQLKPDNETLVAVKLVGHEKLLIRKLFIAGPKLSLKLHDNDQSPLMLMPTLQYKIIGVVVQVNAKT
jgi:hypothetical protein